MACTRMEKVPYEKYMLTYIFFRKAPSRTWRVREGALRKIYAYVYIFRKAPSRTWRVREGALRARMWISACCRRIFKDGTR